MRLRINLLTVISERLLAWRWWLMLLIASLVIFIEVREHTPIYLYALDPDFVRELVLFGLILPLANGIVLTLLLRTRQDRVTAVRDLDQQHSLSQKLSQAKTWDELSDIIVCFAGSQTGVVGTSLYVLSPDGLEYGLVASWTREEQPPVNHISKISAGDCLPCVKRQDKDTKHLAPCTFFNQSLDNGHYSGYCLPLLHQSETIALLSLYYPSEMTISSQEIRVLVGAAPEIAIAIEESRLRQAAINQEEAATIERKRIARNLHDTLGQNISYLRLKLDQFSGEEDALSEISEIRKELERMRDIANDAYYQVRATLADLQPTDTSNISRTLLEHAKQVGARANFDAKLVVRGKTHNLTSKMNRQIFYICKESLNNIEKYAQAKLVTIEINWAKDLVTIIISDDGVGFDTESQPAEGHYGLTIMQERAEEMGGHLRVASDLGGGTRVILELPLGKTNTIYQQNSDLVETRAAIEK